MASPTTPFGPRFVHDGVVSDMKATSADAVDFNVHSRALLTASNNAFDGRMSGSSVPNHPLALPEIAIVLDIVFRSIYGLSCMGREPSLETTEAALDALNKYGVSLSSRAAPTAPLGELLLSYSPHHPLEAFALAAHHGLEALAVPLSAHLLSYNIATLPDELAIKMGSLYLARLFNLHRAREVALKSILLRMPARHPATPVCGEPAQRLVDRAWAFATAGIAWDARPGMTADALAAAYEPARNAVYCADCQRMIRNRIQEMSAEWSAVKSTI